MTIKFLIPQKYTKYSSNPAFVGIQLLFTILNKDFDFFWKETKDFKTFAKCILNI